MGEKFDVSTGADEGCRKHQRRGAIDDRAGERHGKLAEALVGGFLAFRIGVGEEAADGEQQDGAQRRPR